jgi:hypothetical protein
VILKEVAMNIINIEKLDLHKPIVLTGHPKHVRAVAKYLKATLYYAPREEDYYQEYPDVVKELQDTLEYERGRGVVIVTTQSEEFLDCLLQSELDFSQVTVRHYDHDDDDTYRIRVLTKEEAWANRCAWKMELRC